jgi:hypothetical protein
MPSWPITGIALPVRRGGFSRPADANSQPLIDFLYGGNGDLTPISDGDLTPIYWLRFAASDSWHRVRQS